MRYTGGKFRQGKAIAALINGVLRDGDVYIEPFCGALGVASRVACPRMILRDNNEACVVFWDWVVNQGLELPNTVTKKEYDELREAKDPKNPLTFYAGHGFSFSARWFGTYAPHSLKNDPGRVKRWGPSLKAQVMRKAESFLGKVVAFEAGSYEKTKFPPGMRPVLYLDPPYAGSATWVYGGPRDFDHDRFWEWASHRTRNGPVLVTEATAPPGWVAIYSWGNTVSTSPDFQPKREFNERIWVHRSQVSFWKRAAQTQGIPLLV